MADTSVAGAAGSQSGILKKLDSNGNLLWSQYYNFPNAYNLSFNKIKKTLDGNYVVVGVIDYGFGVGPTFQDVFFAKLDTLGNILWMKNFLWPSSLLLILDLSKGLSISDALAGSSSRSNYSFVMNFSRKSKFGGMDSSDTLFLSYSSRSYSPLILK